MIKINYQNELDKIIANLPQNSDKKRLLIHSCCAPCSSYVLEYLSQYFSITVLYFNPNITDRAEYNLRCAEQERFCNIFPTQNKINFVAGEYKPLDFFEATKDLQDEPEGGARCVECFKLRLEHTAQIAKAQNFDYFTTTLTISPLKNSQVINRIGADLQEKYGVNYLFSDFKKREGYKRSIQLSAEYGLYRQNYCGCVFSKREFEAREKT